MLRRTGIECLPPTHNLAALGNFRPITSEAASSVRQAVSVLELVEDAVTAVHDVHVVPQTRPPRPPWPLLPPAGQFQGRKSVWRRAVACHVTPTSAMRPMVEWLTRSARMPSKGALCDVAFSILEISKEGQGTACQLDNHPRDDSRAGGPIKGKPEHTAQS